MIQNLSPSTSARSPEEILSDAQKNSKPSSISPSFLSSLSNNEQAFARFKFHLSTLNVSRSCVQYIKRYLSDRALVKIKWRFMKFEEAVKCRNPLTGTKIDVDSTARYKLMINHDFLDYTENFAVNLDLFAVDKGRELFLGANRVLFSGILQANNIKQERHIEVYNGAVDQNMEKIARIKLWAKFKCDPKFLKQMKKDLSFCSQMKNDLGFDTQRSSLMSTENTIKVTNPEINHDDSNSGSNRSKKAVEPQPDNNKAKLTKFAELKEKVQKLHNKVELKYSLKKTADQRPDPVKEKDLVKQQEADGDSSQLITNYRSEFKIVVVKLLLYETSKVMRNPAVKKLFVEYSFLNYSGPEMETPRSLPKPDNEEPIMFNFGKTFFISTQDNYEDCKILASLIKNDQPIRFVVVSEPPEIPYAGMLMCEEVAFAEVSLSKLVHSTQNQYEEICDVFDWKNRDETIGKLYLRFEGILAVERMLVQLEVETTAKYKQHLQV